MFSFSFQGISMKDQYFSHFRVQCVVTVKGPNCFSSHREHGLQLYQANMLVASQIWGQGENLGCLQPQQAECVPKNIPCFQWGQGLTSGYLPNMPLNLSREHRNSHVSYTQLKVFFLTILFEDPCFQIRNQPEETYMLTGYETSYVVCSHAWPLSFHSCNVTGWESL